MSLPTTRRTGLFWSLYSVWLRHMLVYIQDPVVNILGQLVTPAINFTAFSFGFGRHLKGFEGVPYPTFVASGVLAGSAMSTSAAESTFGAFVRLSYTRTHDAMMATQLTASEVFVGELLFAATKALIISAAVMIMTTALGVPLNPWCVLVPFVTFTTGYVFAALGLIVCSYAKVIEAFNLFLGGFILPMFFFSGTIFPIKRIHPTLDLLAHLLPLTHSVQIIRAMYRGGVTVEALGHLGALCIFGVVFHTIAIRRMRKRIIQ